MWFHLFVRIYVMFITQRVNSYFNTLRQSCQALFLDFLKS
jgi:hypothetical protein